jgi:hypothetical protein
MTVILRRFFPIAPNGREVDVAATFRSVRRGGSAQQHASANRRQLWQLAGSAGLLLGNLLESKTGASECVEAELGLASGVTACVPTGGRVKGVCGCVGG